jgi:hypothetical protein
MRWLGLFLVSMLAAIGLITIIDLATTSGASRLVGGSPVYLEGDDPVVMAGGRIVRFPPLLQQDERRAAVLDEDYFYCVPRNGAVIRLARGYQTDFASIPGFARLLVDRLGGSLEPAGIHDWLYSVGEAAGTPEREAKRLEADDIFLRALEDNDVGLATRTIMYWAVRLFGGDHYGTGEEWKGRLKNPVTGENLKAPPLPPTVGALDVIDCTNFSEEINRLVLCYSTNAEWRLDPSDPGYESNRCREGDGLTVDRSPLA